MLRNLQAADAKAAQQGDQFGIFQDTDRQSCEERRRATTGDDPAILRCGPARRMLCGENAISDPNPEIPNPSTDQMFSYYCCSLFSPP